MAEETAILCSCCGEPLPPGNLAWDLEMPDPVAYLDDDDRAQRTLFESEQVFNIAGLGAFIRVILPVPVEHDRTATFGVWLCVPDAKEWTRINEAARKGGSAWAGITFEGRLATALQPWPDVFGAWTRAVVPGPDQVPRLVHSHDPLLARVLTERWPEELIRARGRHAVRPLSGGPTPNPYRRSLWSRLSGR
ncbi:DUF2199 domain-containing protein [Catellatospora sp. NPDC049133]|jgi:hypothetical protein|uniref:DUF2199 domain-containing protein n=1 Tax=Catellatospora sp. NPDC049133 TaxID=3155499 RepID=UPI0033FEA8A4